MDDGSTTSLEPIVEPFRELLALTLITQPNSGPAIARNTGAAGKSTISDTELGFLGFCSPGYKIKW